MLAICLTMALAGAGPVSPVALEDQVWVEGPYVTLNDVADLSVLPASIRSEAGAIRVARLQAPQQSISASVIASRARSTLPALAPWFCELQDKDIQLYRSGSTLPTDPDIAFRQGQRLTLTITVGRVAVERDVWALQDGRRSGALFVRTAEGEALRVEGANLR